MSDGRKLDELADRAESLLARMGEVLDALAAQQWRDAIWIPEHEAARRLNVTCACLATWRVNGGARNKRGAIVLRWSKPGRSPMYLAQDVEKALRDELRLTTADAPGVARELAADLPPLRSADVCTTAAGQPACGAAGVCTLPLGHRGPCQARRAS